MKIGIFDSGLGGLFIAKSIARVLPNYDYVYLGDTKRLPYGNRSPHIVSQFLQEAVDFLFKKNCKLVVVACNTASADALRKIQREYLPKNYPGRRVLGVIIPAVEDATVSGKHGHIGVLATQGTVNSQAYVRELKKRQPGLRITQAAAPLLVPLVEYGGLQWADDILEFYLKPLKKKKIDALLLGCTHYPILKSRVKKVLGARVRIISQDEIVPGKLKDYLRRHPEIDRVLGKHGKIEFLVTDITPQMRILAQKWFGKNARLKLVSY